MREGTQRPERFVPTTPERFILAPDSHLRPVHLRRRGHRASDTAVSRAASIRNRLGQSSSVLYGMPTKVVTLCPVSDSDTREFATVTPEPATRFLLAEVSQGISVHGGAPEM